VGTKEHAGALQLGRHHEHHRPLRRTRGLPRVPNSISVRRTHGPELHHLSHPSARYAGAGATRKIEHIPFVTGWGDNWIRVGSLKTIADGGILIGTAYLREPYGPNTRIIRFYRPYLSRRALRTQENLFEMAKTAAELGWQMTAHTTGGGATDVLLDAYENVNRTIPIRDRRFTVTHGTSRMRKPASVRRSSALSMMSSRFGFTSTVRRSRTYLVLSG